MAIPNKQTTDYETVIFERIGPRANITINRPAKRNALNSLVIRELVRAFEECRRDSAVRVVVLSGAGDKAFCAGADLAEQQAAGGDYQRYLDRQEFVNLWKIVPALGKPVIAKVQGLTLAGGLGLAANCDFVIASEKARFGAPEINVGLFPMMISAILVRNLGRKKAVDLMFTGRQIDALEAERIGLVSRVVPAEQLASEVDSLANDLAGKSPAILKLGKDALNTSGDMAFEEALDYLATMLTMCSLTEDFKEGLTAFVEKRTPAFKGR